MKSRPRFSPSCLLAIALVLLSVGGACCLQPDFPVGIDPDGATVQVAVLSVAPWSACRDELQPNFPMSGAQALDAAVPNTLDLEQKLLTTFSASAQIAFAAGATGMSPQAPSPSSPAPNSATAQPAKTASPAAATQPANSALNGTLGIDPLLKYNAATALFQEVKLLNRYLKDAAIPDDYVPYVVRIQVSLMPWKRNQPYDAYSLLTFFDARGDAEPPVQMVAQSTAPAASKHPSAPGPQVLPLLVTDDLEASLQSQSAEEVQQFALTLAAAVHGIGASGSVQNASDTSRAVYGHTLNSTFTVSRLSDNTLRIRLGAIDQPAGYGRAGYTMVPQTHNVSLLLLVPRAAATSATTQQRKLYLYTNTLLVNAKDGTSLPPRTKDQYNDQVFRLMRFYGYTKTKPSEIGDMVTKLGISVAISDFDQFAATISGPMDWRPGDSRIRSFWSDFTELRVGSKIATAMFVVPRLLEPSWPGQTPLLFDDAKTSTQAVIYGVSDLDLGAIAAGYLRYQPKSSPAPNVTLAATAMALSPDGRQLQLTFPSLADVGLPPADPAQVEVHIQSASSSWQPQALTAHYLQKSVGKPSAPAATVAVAVSAKVIVPDSKATGKLQVVFANLDPKNGDAVTLSLSGADIDDASIDTGTKNIVQREGTDWKVLTNGVATLPLANLSSAAPVTVTVTQKGHAAIPATTLQVGTAQTPSAAGKGP
jgi:hypothetical protein